MSLREKAHAAWQKQQQLKKQELEQRIELEPQVLQETLRRICGDEFEVRVYSEAERVTAEVDGMLFVSTYNERYYLQLPSDFAERQAGVRLWWKCEQCQGHEQSDVIREDYELGDQLERFDPEKSHGCKNRMKG
jgi:hypothetical protein